MNHSYVHRLQTVLVPLANPDNAVSMQAYMRNLFPFLGIKTSERTALTKAFFKEYGLPQASEQKQVVQALWALPEREYQYIAMSILEKQSKAVDESMIDLLEELIVTKSWWDTVDFLASHLVGNYFRQYPQAIPHYTEKWLASGNIWLQRTAILYQLKYKQDTDRDRLFQIIRSCLPSDEFFIQKAIGWALREYTKTDPAPVLRFMEDCPLPPLSRREALKVIQRQETR